MIDKKEKKDITSIYFASNIKFKKNDIIKSFNNTEYLVIKTPRNKWYHILLNLISLNTYTLTNNYKVMITIL
jgi:hypothetical protein